MSDYKMGLGLEKIMAEIEYTLDLHAKRSNELLDQFGPYSPELDTDPEIVALNADLAALRYKAEEAASTIRTSRDREDCRGTSQAF